MRDNYNNYTFVQNAPPVAFSSTIDEDNISHAFTINGQTYWSGFAMGTGTGGFHLVVLDRTTLALKQNAWWLATAGSNELNDIVNDINGHNSYNNLLFFATFGDTRYTASTGSAGTQARGNWFNASKTMADVGGTQQVFYLMNNPENDPPQSDSYTLVGAFQDNTLIPTGLENVYAAEKSSVIARETETTPMLNAYGISSDVEGILKMDNQGYYSAHEMDYSVGFTSDATADALGASLLPPTPWPLPGSDPANAQAAYTWISQQLCCNDIRAAYVNQNVSPVVWLVQLQGLSFNSNSQPTYDQESFDDMKQQLATEFLHLASVRLLQSNITNLYTAQQSNVGLLLQAAYDTLKASLNVEDNQPSQSLNWTGILEDVFGVLGAVSGALSLGDPATAPEAAVGIGITMAFSTLLTAAATAETNTAAGTGIAAEDNLLTTAGNLASSAADKYARSLITLGNQFDRIVTDWGRLKALGGPLVAGQLPWSASASGTFLTAYDRSIQREFTVELLKVNNQITYYPYVNDTRSVGNITFDNGDDGCDFESQYNDNQTPYWGLASSPILYYPSGQRNDDSHDPHGTDYPYDYQWAIWGLVEKGHEDTGCVWQAPHPSVAGLFNPLNASDPTALGQYRLWLFTREGLAVFTRSSDIAPCYDSSCF